MCHLLLCGRKSLQCVHLYGTSRTHENGFQLLAWPKEREWRGAWRPGGGADGGRPCFRLLYLPQGLEWRDSDALKRGQGPQLLM